MPRHVSGSALDHLAFAPLDGELLLALIGLDRHALGLPSNDNLGDRRTRNPADLVRLYRRWP